MKSHKKSEVPISFSLLQGRAEMENLEKFKLTQEFLCRIATVSVRAPVLSSRAVTAAGTDISSGMFCRSHHQSIAMKHSSSNTVSRLLLSVVGEKSFGVFASCSFLGVFWGGVVLFGWFGFFCFFFLLFQSKCQELTYGRSFCCSVSAWQNNM